MQMTCKHTSDESEDFEVTPNVFFFAKISSIAFDRSSKISLPLLSPFTYNKQ